MSSKVSCDLLQMRQFLDVARCTTDRHDALQLNEQVEALAHQFFQNREGSPAEIDEMTMNLGTVRSLLKQCQTEPRETRETKVASYVQTTLRGHVNLICKTAPCALVSQGYQTLCTPFIGYYNRGNEYQMLPTQLLVKFPKEYLANVPHSVREAVSSATQIDMFFILADLSLNTDWEHHNLVTHPWMFPALRAGDDIKKFPKIGVFDAMGIHGLNRGKDSLPIDRLQETEVYAHPKNNAMAISPDNAQFGVDDAAPFSAFWTVCIDRTRALVAYQVQIHRAEDPFCQTLLQEPLVLGASLNEAAELAQKQAQLPAWKDLVADIANSRKNGMDRFRALRPQERNAIFGEIWRLHGSPMGNPSFGSDSFYGLDDVPSHQRSTPAQRAQAIDSYFTNRSHHYSYLGLSHTINSLFVKQTVVRSEAFEIREQLLSPIIDLFSRGDTERGLKLFDELDPSHKNRIYGEVWKLQGSPYDIDNFGPRSFRADTSLAKYHRCDNQDRIEALSLYMMEG
jgi:hypothetical protein